MSHQPLRPAPAIALIPALALLLLACSSAGVGPSGVPSGGPSGSATAAPTESSEASPAGDRIDHLTGATDILLRYEEVGGHMMASFTASMTPHFTLYGDGTVIFRNPAQEIPPMQGSVPVFNPLRTATLSEEQIQDLLVLALGEGGLAAARRDYRNDMVADASTATFTVNASGINKSVAIYALGMEVQGLADAPARAAFAKLAERLTDFDQGGTVPTDVFTPEAYRATLFESPGAVVPDLRAWPWPDLAVTDFKPSADPNGLQFPHRTMTAEELAPLKVTDFEGGFQAVVITGPDGKTYTLSARPILPDESE